MWSLNKIIAFKVLAMFMGIRSSNSKDPQKNLWKTLQQEREVARDK
jgi:hypothetical protein